MNSWSNKLEQELDWREGELASLKILAVTMNNDSTRYSALLRCLVVMLYAHYEGFCKFAWDFYLESIEKQSLTRNQCCETITIFSLKKTFKRVANDLSPKSLWQFFSEDLHHVLNEELKFELELETKSNLWPNLLQSNLEEINLCCPIIDSHRQILKGLVNRRNDIAHGKSNIIKSIQEYEQYEKAVIEVMYELALTIMESLDSQSYLST
jgi:hypothetical protein